MIEEPPLLTIKRHVSRPHEAVVRALAEAPTGFLVDAMNGRGALDYRIKPLAGAQEAQTRAAGVALTCHCGPDDNLALSAALALAEPGDVLVAATDGFAGTAILGDHMLGMARNRGVVAIVTDGLVRDLEGLLGVGLPVFARGLTPNSAMRNGPGTVGLPVTLAGMAVASGDIVVADADGVVIVPQADAAAVVAKLEQVRAAEAELEKKVKGGLSASPAMEALLASDRVHWLE